MVKTRAGPCVRPAQERSSAVMSAHPPSHPPRRGFLKPLGGLAAAVTAWPALTSAQTSVPGRRAGAKYMGDFAAPKLDKVRVAIIGLGARGSVHAPQLADITGTVIVGLSDLYEDW